MESFGEIDIIFDWVGELVMEVLKSVDSVVYVCYVLVYKDFYCVEDFCEFIKDEYFGGGKNM